MEEEKPIAKEEPKKQGTIDYAVEPFKKWYEFIKVNVVQYYVGLLKISFSSLIATSAIWLFFALLAAGLYAGVGGLEAFTDTTKALQTLMNIPLLLAFVLLFIIASILTAWVNNTIILTSVIFTDDKFKNRDFSITRAFDKIKGKVFRFLVLDYVIRSVLSIPLFVSMAIVFVLMMGTFAGAFAASLQEDEEAKGIWGIFVLFPLAMMFVMVVALITFAVGVLYSYIAQFWIYGFILDGRGVIDSLKYSIKLALAKIPELVVFDILLYIGVIIFSLPIFLYSVFVQIAWRVIGVIFTMGYEGVFELALIFICLNIIIMMVLGVIVQAFRLPNHYLFWKKIKADVGEA